MILLPRESLQFFVLRTADARWPRRGPRVPGGQGSECADPWIPRRFDAAHAAGQNLGGDNDHLFRLRTLFPWASIQILEERFILWPLGV
jgi:hypothetical protein